ncbi:hypothetical protein DFH06DRAFT_1091879 [Mycena polygramma]|nr:hypothetical protein DFH06DRAFT_1091879 [Mycena polygramma]
MSSVDELRARIARLSTTIDLQRALLKKLEHEKSVVQRELNAVSDPVARLPLEISSVIFLLSIPRGFPMPDVDAAPMLLLNVCHAWRTIALSTPALWAAVQMTVPCSQAIRHGLQAWLERACNRPLSISLHGPGDFLSGETDIVWQHSHQLRHLELYHEWEEDAESMPEEVDLLGAIPGPLPALRTLAIHGSIDDTLTEQEYSSDQILELLGRAYNLVECSLTGDAFPLSRCTPQMLVLPALRRLSFGSLASGNNNEEIMNRLSLPGLVALSVSSSIEDLLLFLERSTPHLRELAIWAPYFGNCHLEPFRKCLRLLPTLTHLEMWWHLSTYPLAEIIGSLAEVPSLCSLAIRNYTVTFSPALWKSFLSALTERHAELRIVHIELYTAKLSERPTPDVLAGLRELVADGVEIYVGPEESNLLSAAYFA